MDLFELVGTIIIKNDEANKELDETSKRGEKTQSKLSEAFSSVGKGAAVVGKAVGTGLMAGGAAMGALTVKALNLSGELEQNMGGSEQVFAEYAGKMQETAKTAFSSMGLSTSDFLGTANKMGALFQGAGFSIKESSELSASAMQRAADVASIMGIDTASAMEAIAGAAKGNFTMMDNLGVAMNDTAIQNYALSKGINKSTSEMTQQEKIGLAMEMFMDKTAYAAGNYAKENQTLAGALGTAKSALTNFLDGSGDVDGLVTAFSNAATVIVDNVTTIAPRLVSGITEIVNKIIPLLPPMLGKLLPPIIQGAISLLNGLVATIPSIIPILLDSLPALIQGGVQLVVALVNALPYIISALIEAMPVVIASLVSALVKAAPALIQGMINIWNSVKNGVVKVLGQLVDTAVNWVKQLGTNIANIFGNIKTKVSTIWNGIMNAIKTPINKAKDIVKGAIDAIKGFFGFKISWPKIPMPHFGISPKGWKIGDLLKGSIPKLAIDWYAKGGVMNGPTLFDYNPATGTAKVGGEAGAEAVAPIDTLQQYIRAAVQSETGAMDQLLQRIIDLLTQFFPQMLDALDIDMYLDGEVLVARTAPAMNRALGKIAIQKGRGR